MPIYHSSSSAALCFISYPGDVLPGRHSAGQPLATCVQSYSTYSTESADERSRDGIGVLAERWDTLVGKLPGGCCCEERPLERKRCEAGWFHLFFPDYCTRTFHSCLSFLSNSSRTWAHFHWKPPSTDIIINFHRNRLLCIFEWHLKCVCTSLFQPLVIFCFYTPSFNRHHHHHHQPGLVA